MGVKFIIAGKKRVKKNCWDRLKRGEEKNNVALVGVGDRIRPKGTSAVCGEVR